MGGDLGEIFIDFTVENLLDFLAKKIAVDTESPSGIQEGLSRCDFGLIPRRNFRGSLLNI